MTLPPKTEPVSVHTLYMRAVAALRSWHGSEAAFEARSLVQRALGMDAATLVMQMHDGVVSGHERDRFEAMLGRRLRHEPLSRIVGQREFYGLSFAITPHTLDPRADSETLIEAFCALYPDRSAPLRLMDLGTGTGCLIITLLTLWPHARGWAVDCSPEALETAARNARAHGVAERLTLLHQSFDDILLTGQKPWPVCDGVVSNPPYIPTGDIPSLPEPVSLYDPLLALDGGSDGLQSYRALARLLPQVCAPGGHVVLETGHTQAGDVQNLFHAPLWHHHTPLPDLAGHPRAVVMRKNPEPHP